MEIEAVKRFLVSQKKPYETNTEQNKKHEREEKIMARERMVTRIVTTTEYQVMAVNPETKTVETVAVNIASAVNMTDKQVRSISGLYFHCHKTLYQNSAFQLYNY